MTALLQIELLGNIEITQQGVPVTGFISQKSKALFCYLAFSGQSHTREKLATLLWGNMPDTNARTNLRKALSNLKKIFPEHLHITRHSVAFNTDAPHHIDVQNLQHALNAIVDLTEITPSAIEHLAVAISHYRGDFLDDIHPKDAMAFDEWVIIWRERLRTMAMRGLHILMIEFAKARNYSLAIQYATRLLVLDSWREETHRQLMLLLARSGQQSAALAQYRQCQNILLDELGIEPMRETTLLYERIRNMYAAEHFNVPAQPTPFVGRQTELAEINRRLLESDDRLVTLVGMGGMGKTRLAIESATQLRGEFLDGVYFIPLESVTHADQLFSVIADVLQIPFQDQSDPQEQLLNFLATREVLLVLDNFEHLLPNTSPLINILEHVPALKIIVTSRQQLNIDWERPFILNGLDVPPPMARIAGSPNESIDNIGNYSAVQLFLKRARRINSKSNLNAEAYLTISKICRLLDGLPLGIELAASWRHLFSCDEIAQKLEYDLDFLSASTGTTDHHRDMRTVLDYSWQFLSSVEKTLLAQLSIFHDGFDLAAATDIADAKPELMRALLNKSLIHHTDDTRYTMHALWRQYLNEKLPQVADEEMVKTRHSIYYARLLHRYVDNLSPNQKINIPKILQDSQNFQAGLRWMTAQKKWESAIEFAEDLMSFYKTRGQFQNIVALLMPLLSQIPANYHTRKVRWQRVLGEAYFSMGKLSESGKYLLPAVASLDKTVPDSDVKIGIFLGVELLRQIWHRIHRKTVTATETQHIQKLEAVRAYERLGQIYFFANRSLPTTYTALRGLNLAENISPSPELARLYASVALAMGLIPLHSMARLYIRLALETAEKLDHHSAMAWVLEIGSIYFTGIGRWEKARQMALHGAELGKQLNNPRRWEENMIPLGYIAQYQGNFESAIKIYRDVYLSAFQRGDVQVQRWALASEGETRLALGQLNRSLQLMTQTLNLHLGTEDIVTDLCCHAIAGVVHLRQNQFDEAFESAEKASALIVQSSPPTSFTAFEGYAGVAEIYIRLWQKVLSGESISGDVSVEELHRRAMYAIRNLKNFAHIFPIAKTRALLWQGYMTRYAQKLWRSGIAHAER